MTQSHIYVCMTQRLIMVNAYLKYSQMKRSSNRHPTCAPQSLKYLPLVPLQTNLASPWCSLSHWFTFTPLPISIFVALWYILKSDSIKPIALIFLFKIIYSRLFAYPYKFLSQFTNFYKILLRLQLTFHWTSKYME